MPLVSFGKHHVMFNWLPHWLVPELCLFPETDRGQQELHECTRVASRVGGARTRWFLILLCSAGLVLALTFQKKIGPLWSCVISWGAGAGGLWALWNYARSLRAALRQGLWNLGLCPSCGYDRRGNPSDLCPECGKAYLPDSPRIPARPAPSLYQRERTIAKGCTAGIFIVLGVLGLRASPRMAWPPRSAASCGEGLVFHAILCFAFAVVCFLLGFMAAFAGHTGSGTGRLSRIAILCGVYLGGLGALVMGAALLMG